MDRISDLARIRRMQQSGEAKRLRERAGISLRTMARAVGVRASTLIRWEAGRVRPREGTALAWLAALDRISAELDRERIRAQVRSSRQRQGLPEHITDAELLDRLAAAVLEREGERDGRG
jgi:transcriptional regulator with XRE-family HTH domain